MPSPEFLRRDADPAPDSLLIAAAQVRRGGGSNREARAGSGHRPRRPGLGGETRAGAARGSAGSRALARLRCGLARSPRPGLAAPRRRPFLTTWARETAQEQASGRWGAEAPTSCCRTQRHMPPPLPSRSRGTRGPRGCRWRPKSQRGKQESPSGWSSARRRARLTPRAGAPSRRAGPEVLQARSRRRPRPAQLSPLPRRSHLHYWPLSPAVPPQPHPRPHPGQPPAPRPASGRDEIGCADRGPRLSRVGGVGGERGRGPGFRTRRLGSAPPLISGVGFSRVGVSVYRVCSSWPTPLFLPPVAGLLLVLCLLWFPQQPDTHTQDQECSDWKLIPGGLQFRFSEIAKAFVSTLNAALFSKGLSWG